MATVTRAQFPDLQDLNFYSIAFEGFTRWPPIYSTYTDVRSSSKAAEKVSQVAGVGLPGIKTEGSGMDFDTPVQMYDTTYTHVARAKGIRFTKESVDDDQFKILGNPMFKQLGVGHSQSIETVAATTLNNGFTTAGADGKVLFATDHPRTPLDSTSHSNRPATGVALSVSALENALINANDCLDPAGLKMMWRPMSLVVPTALEFTAKKILQSQPEAFIADNTKNVLPKLNIVVNPYLTSSTAWFVLAAKGDNPLLFWMRTAPEYYKDTDFDSRDLKYGSYARYISGHHSDWRGGYASPGA